MNLGHRVATNTIIQIGGRAIGLLLMLVTLNYISNHLIVNGSSLVGYGRYTIIFAYASLIGAAADLGLFSLLVRDITGKTRAETEKLISSAIGFRSILLLFAFVLIVVIYPFLPYSPDVKNGILLAVLIAFSLLFSQSIASIFQVNLVSHRIVIAETIGRLIVMLATIYVLQRGMGLLAVVWAHLLGYSTTIILSYWLALPFATPTVRFDTRIWREALPQFLPLAMITLLSLTHSRIDSILLSFFRSEAEVGLYGVAYKIYEIAIVIPSIVATNLLPVITKLYSDNRLEEFQTVLRRSSSILFFLAAAVIVFVFSLAPYLIVFISSSEFIGAVLPLRILILAMLFVFLATFLIQALLSARQHPKLIGGYIIALLLNVVLNLWAIPRYSIIGAATTTFITESVLAAAILLTSYRHIRFNLEWSRIIQILFSTIVTLVISHYLIDRILVPLNAFSSIGKFDQILVIFVGSIITLGLLFVSTLIISGGKIAPWRFRLTR
jgi:O-antigen/teichoic acid export membrane protein